MEAPSIEALPGAQEVLGVRGALTDLRQRCSHYCSQAPSEAAANHAGAACSTAGTRLRLRMSRSLKPQA